MASDLGAVLGSISVKYLKSVEFPDKVHVRTRIKSVGTSSITLEHEIESAKLGVATTGESVMVFLNTNTGKTAPIPPAIRSKL
jgi:acyl-CoA thioester hydrolase